MASGKIAETNTKIGLVIPKELKNKADQVANADGRSLASWIRKLIVDEINRIEKDGTH